MDSDLNLVMEQILTGILFDLEIVPVEVQAAIEVAANNDHIGSVMELAIKAYRVLEMAHIVEELISSDNVNDVDCPKIRDYMSLVLVFRTQLKRLRPDLKSG